ncbi:MAG TPA: STAS/SEC14 domain-containing protein [Polyangiaceae bacterium]
MPFEIIVHDAESIIEIIYPEKPTRGDVDDYVNRVKKIISRRRAPWLCLVDQRQLNLMPDGLYEQIAALNVYAQQRGMIRSARVVSSAVATLQANRMQRQSGLERPVRTFTSRDEAVAWLRR